MSTAAQSTPQWPQSLAWLRGFLREELAPYPGRSARVARMVLAAAVVMVLTMTFRIPYGAYGALYALTISRENPDATLREVRTIIVSFALAVATVLASALLFSGDPAARLVWVPSSFLLTFFVLSTLSNYGAGARFGYLIVITTPLWDEHIRAETKVEQTLWAVAAVSLASIVTAAIELVFARLKRGDDLIDSIAERLESVERLLRSYAQETPDQAAEQKIIRLSMLGTSRMRRDLQRSSYAAQFAEQMGAVVSFTGRLVDIAAYLAQFPVALSELGRIRLRNLIQNIAAIREDLLARRVPHLATGGPEPDEQQNIPLLREMERTVSLMVDVFTGGQPIGAVAQSIEPAEPPKRIFVPDAFSNPDHIRFAIRGGLAASICYITYNLVDWPGISTSVTTCLVTALTTVGSSRQKQVLRFAGALVGCFLGMGSQVFILPALDSITGFLLLFLAVSGVAAWCATSGPRLSYFGVQIAVAFYLINLEEFKFQTSLAVARDRVVGVLLGLLAMWLAFDQLWGASAITQMLRSFTSTLRLLAQFQREPVSPNIQAAIERSFALRNNINNNFEKLRQYADGVILEFGPTRSHDLALRSQILEWQRQLRLIFIARVTLFKYRLGLPGFELPAPIQSAQKAFDDHLATTLDAMADRFGSKEAKPAASFKPALEDLEHIVEEGYPTETQTELAARLRTFLPLSQRIAALVRSLDREI
jgi:multidrug resistance protein MdtO